MVVENIARNQDDSNTMMITCPRDMVYSPVPPTARGIGRKARMVVSDAVNNGMARVLPEARTASLRSWPDSRRTRMSSATTMPLSTNMPRAMIIDAMDMRCNSTSMVHMMTRPISMAKGTKEPTISPVRKPRKRITTNSTMTRD